MKRVIQANVIQRPRPPETWETIIPHRFAAPPKLPISEFKALIEAELTKHYGPHPEIEWGGEDVFDDGVAARMLAEIAAGQVEIGKSHLTNIRTYFID